MTACLATCADLPTGRDGAPGSRPGPLERREEEVLACGLLAFGDWRRGLRASRPLRLRRRGFVRYGRNARLRGTSLRPFRNGRNALLDARSGSLLGLGVVTQGLGVLVPVGLAHPAEPV